MQQPTSLDLASPILRPQMPELDTLRGIAVSMVVLFHALGFSYGLGGLSGISRIVVGVTLSGWVGVNLFFVLSGFLITGILLDTNFRADYYKRFYLRRALRILPLYYAVLVLLLLLGHAGLVPRHVSWAFLGLSAIYLSNITNLFGVPMQYGVLWSLAVEEHFYLLWPTVVRALSRRKVISCAFVVVALCVLLRTLYCVLGWRTGPYTWLSADGLALGAVLAAVARGKGNPRNSVSRFSILAFVSSFALLAFGAPFGIFFARHFLGIALRETAIDLFFAGVVGSTLLLGSSKRRGLVNLSIFQFLGRISYGVYLTHMLIFEAVAHLTLSYCPTLMPSAGHFNLIALQFCIAGSLTIGISYLSRGYFEEPFLRLKDYAADQSITRPGKPVSEVVSDLELVAS
jgi:peptidoglycan/LPS O-acetylase OafA/YrhL